MTNPRQIIYVDAGSTNSKNFRISLYDKSNNATHIMELFNIDNNNEAEKYAIFNAIFYIYKNNYTYCMILCDNKSAVEDEIIIALSKECKVDISWIPREINKVADKVCKLETTLKDRDFYTLDLFVKLSKKAYSIKPSNINLQTEITKLKKEIQVLKTKVKNQATQITNMKNNKVKVK